MSHTSTDDDVMRDLFAYPSSGLRITRSNVAEYQRPQRSTLQAYVCITCRCREGRPWWAAVPPPPGTTSSFRTARRSVGQPTDKYRKHNNSSRREWRRGFENGLLSTCTTTCMRRNHVHQTQVLFPDLGSLASGCELSFAGMVSPSAPHKKKFRENYWDCCTDVMATRRYATRLGAEPWPLESGVPTANRGSHLVQRDGDVDRVVRVAVQREPVQKKKVRVSLGPVRYVHLFFSPKITEKTDGTWQRLSAAGRGGQVEVTD